MLKRSTAAVACALLLSLAAPTAASAQSWQCAPFARVFSGLQLFGAAASWWKQAVGKYLQGRVPQPGAVLVFKAAGAMRSGHVATVTRVVSERIIKVTHANWSPINGRRGQVERDVIVVDASSGGDWSKVRVWYKPIGDVGIRAYPTEGFIYASAGKAVAAVRDTAAKASEATPLPYQL